MEEDMKQRLVIAAVLSVPWAAGAQSLVTERTLSIGAAQEAARVALEQCRKDGHRVTVTVLDHAARTKVVLRDDGASPHSLQHSLNKAYTALLTASLRAITASAPQRISRPAPGR
jgi:uncharacterized protein GlcG (DUF336 family)